MRRLITLATLSMALVTCVWTFACKDQGQVKAAKLAAIAKRMKKNPLPGWEARLSEAKAQVEARLLEERKAVAKRVELFIKKSPITFE